MRWNSPLALLLVALLAATGGLVASVAWFGGYPAISHSPLLQALLGKWLYTDFDGAKVAPFELPRVDGGSMRLPPPGRPVLINYWASWCGPCREEMPLLEAYARSQGPAGIQVVGVALDSPDAAKSFLVDTPVSFPILVEPPGSSDSSTRFGNTGGLLPFSVLVDSQGRLVTRRAGPFFGGPELEAWARRAR
jgi:thiol-disulfide isomerase/thioredoxin